MHCGGCDSYILNRKTGFLLGKLYLSGYYITLVARPVLRMAYLAKCRAQFVHTWFNSSLHCQKVKVYLFQQPVPNTVALKYKNAIICNANKPCVCEDDINIVSVYSTKYDTSELADI